MTPGDLDTPDVSETDLTPNGLPDWLAGCDGADLTGGFLGDGLPTEDDLSGGSWAPPSPAPAPPPVAPLASATPPAAGVVETPAPARTPPPVGDPRAWNVTDHAVAHDPTGDPESLSYRINLKNHSPSDFCECALEFDLPTDLKGVRASGNPRRTTAGLEWNLGALAPGATSVIRVRLPMSRAAARFRTHPALVRVATRAVAAPAARLDVTCDRPSDVAAGRPVPLRVTVANRGNVPSSRLAIAAFAPDQVTPAVEGDAPPVAPGCEHATELILPPSPPGPTRWRVVVSAAGLPPVHTTVEYTTTAADLWLDLSVPERVDTDDEVTCRLTVANRGTAAAAPVSVTCGVPEEMVFRGATAGGTLSLAGDCAEWTIPGLAAGGRWEASVRLAGFAPGRVQLIATAAAPGALGATGGATLVCEVRRTAGGASLSELLAGLALGTGDDADADPVAHSAEDVRERHLMFRVAGGRFAMLLRNVREVLRPPAVTVVPGTPAWMAGVANVRGDIVPVIDLAGFLGLGRTDAPRGLVIINGDGDGHSLGLFVDDVAGIRPLAASEDAVPVEGRVVRFLAGVAVDPTGVVHRLDATKLLAAADLDLAATD